MKPFIDECGIIHIAYMATATFLSKEVVTTSGKDLISTWQELFQAPTSPRKGNARAFLHDRFDASTHPPWFLWVEESALTTRTYIPVTPPNKYFTFSDGFAPKKCPPVTLEEIQNIQRDREAQRLTQAREKEELVAKKQEELDVEQLRAVWQSIRCAGFRSLHEGIQMMEV